jgi:hypothetical protein
MTMFNLPKKRNQKKLSPQKKINCQSATIAAQPKKQAPLQSRP